MAIAGATMTAMIVAVGIAAIATMIVETMTATGKPQ
jgi:hypothetical protein